MYKKTWGGKGLFDTNAFWFSKFYFGWVLKHSKVLMWVLREPLILFSVNIYFVWLSIITSYQNLTACLNRTKRCSYIKYRTNKFCSHPGFLISCHQNFVMGEFCIVFQSDNHFCLVYCCFFQTKTFVWDKIFLYVRINCDFN